MFRIFEHFAAGDSLGKNSTSSARMNVLSPAGKDIWSKGTISKILSNEKYIGDVVLGEALARGGVQVENSDAGAKIVMIGQHPTVISKDLFELVQKEKRRRCALMKDKKRTNERYKNISPPRAKSHRNLG